MRKTLLLLCTLSLAATLRASDTDHDGFETVLVPIAMLPSTEVPGALGTLWRSAVLLHNPSGHEVWLQAKYGCQFPCQSPYPAAFAGMVTEAITGSSAGVLFYLKVEDAAQIVLTSRLYEVSRRAQPEGIEIPVVREGAFFKRPSSFLAVPGGTGARAALRVYDPRRAGVTLKVEALSADAGQVLATTQLTTAVATAPGLDTLVTPGFAAIYDLAAAFPILNTVTAYHLRVTPVSPDAEYWAMVSATDNETQHVLLITSQ